MDGPVDTFWKAVGDAFQWWDGLTAQQQWLVVGSIVATGIAVRVVAWLIARTPAPVAAPQTWTPGASAAGSAAPVGASLWVFIAVLTLVVAGIGGLVYFGGVQRQPQRPAAAAAPSAATETERATPTARTASPTESPAPWPSGYREALCGAIRSVTATNEPLLDAAIAQEGPDLAALYVATQELSRLAQETQAILVTVPAWAPGSALVNLLRRNAEDLQEVADLFNTAIEEGDQDALAAFIQAKSELSGDVLELAAAQQDRLEREYGLRCG